jgi:hypothetical protein
MKWVRVRKSSFVAIIRIALSLKSGDDDVLRPESETSSWTD